MSKKLKQKSMQAKSRPRNSKLFLTGGIALALTAGLAYNSMKKPRLEEVKVVKMVVETSVKSAFAKLSETTFFRHANEVQKKVQELQSIGRLKVRHRPYLGKNKAAVFKYQSKEIYNSFDESNPGLVFSNFHEGTHALTYEHVQEDPVLDFLRKNAAFSVNENAKTELRVDDSLAKKYFETLNPVERQSNANAKGDADTNKVRKLINSKLKAHAEKIRQLHVISEIHANLFDERGVLTDKEFFDFLGRNYKKHSSDLTFEKFKAIKANLLGLYHTFAGNEVHVKIAEFVGKNGLSYDNFIEKARSELKKSRVSEKDLKEAEEKRKHVILSAIKSVGLTPQMLWQHKQ